MPIFHLQFLGRFGNNLFSYAFARGFCERNGYELHTDPWPGEKVFNLSHPRCYQDLPRRDEFSINDSERGDISYRSYSQQQKCVDYYSVSDCRRWLEFRETAKMVGDHLLQDVDNYAVAHVRRGDYGPLGYVLVDKESYMDSAQKYGLDWKRLAFLGDENPWGGTSDAETVFLPDFYRMCKTEHLFRSNSSFSFWAAVLNPNRVFAPIIDGKTGGFLQHCEFVEGNWPRLANFDFTTDLRMRE